jgi:hypothetical protein
MRFLKNRKNKAIQAIHLQWPDFSKMEAQIILIKIKFQILLEDI